LYRYIKERVTELLASPTPFAAALGALDAFAVQQESGTEMRLKEAATAGGDEVVETLNATQRPMAGGFEPSRSTHFFYTSKLQACFRLYLPLRTTEATSYNTIYQLKFGASKKSQAR
jgi:hypothetical protein